MISSFCWKANWTSSLLFSSSLSIWDKVFNNFFLNYCFEYAPTNCAKNLFFEVRKIIWSWGDVILKFKKKLKYENYEIFDDYSTFSKLKDLSINSISTLELDP